MEAGELEGMGPIDYVLVEAPAWISYPACSTFACAAIVMSGHHQTSFIYFQF